MRGQELRRYRLAVVFVGDHHDFLFQIDRHVIDRRQRQVLRDDHLLGQADPSMIARELGDGLVHALLQQVLVAEQAMQDVTFPVELQRFRHTATGDAVRRQVGLLSCPGGIVKRVAAALAQLVGEQRVLMAGELAGDGRHDNAMRVHQVIGGLGRGDFLVQLVNLVECGDITGHTAHCSHRDTPITSHNRKVHFHRSAIFRPSS